MAVETAVAKFVDGWKDAYQQALAAGEATKTPANGKVTFELGKEISKTFNLEDTAAFNSIESRITPGVFTAFKNAAVELQGISQKVLVQKILSYGAINPEDVEKAMNKFKQAERAFRKAARDADTLDADADAVAVRNQRERERLAALQLQEEKRAAAEREKKRLAEEARLAAAAGTSSGAPLSDQEQLKELIRRLRAQPGDEKRATNTQLQNIIGAVGGAVPITLANFEAMAQGVLKVAPDQPVDGNGELRNMIRFVVGFIFIKKSEGKITVNDIGSGRPEVFVSLDALWNAYQSAWARYLAGTTNSQPSTSLSPPPSKSAAAGTSSIPEGTPEVRRREASRLLAEIRSSLAANLAD